LSKISKNSTSSESKSNWT